MNIFKKLYCRVFQGVFYLALPFLPYRQPETFPSAEMLGGLLAGKNIMRVLLVTDKSLRDLGVTKPLEDRLTAQGISVAVYDGTVANPTTDNIAEAVRLYFDNDCRAIIGFGGGSAIDCAKAAGAKIARPGKTLLQMKGLLKVRKKTPLLIAIPTTAGTGSEATLAAVITDSETRHKFTINDFPLIPSYAVLDPEITRTLPKGLTATTGMDALTHAVEAFIGRSTTKETRKFALEATGLIFGNIRAAYNDGSDMEARAKMLRASYLAGCAFTKSYVGYVHAVAHSLGGKYNTPHGLANAVLLPRVLEAYGARIYKKLYRLAAAAGVASESDTYGQGAVKFIAAIKQLNADLGIPETLKGVNEADIAGLARYADKEANPLYPVPALMDAERLKQFYYKVMEK